MVCIDILYRATLLKNTMKCQRSCLTCHLLFFFLKYLGQWCRELTQVWISQLTVSQMCRVSREYSILYNFLKMFSTLHCWVSHLNRKACKLVMHSSKRNCKFHIWVSLQCLSLKEKNSTWTNLCQNLHALHSKQPLLLEFYVKFW